MDSWRFYHWQTGLKACYCVKTRFYHINNIIIPLIGVVLTLQYFGHPIILSRGNVSMCFGLNTNVTFERHCLPISLCSPQFDNQPKLYCKEKATQIRGYELLKLAVIAPLTSWWDRDKRYFVFVVVHAIHWTWRRTNVAFMLSLTVLKTGLETQGHWATRGDTILMTVVTLSCFSYLFR